VEYKLRRVNFWGLSDPRRAFWPAFRVPGISDDWYRSAMGVTVIRVRRPRSTSKNCGYTREHMRALMTSPEPLTTSQGALKADLRVLTTGLGAPTNLGAT